MGFEDMWFGVLEGDVDIEYSVVVLVVEIDIFWDFIMGDIEEDSVMVVVVCGVVGFEGERGFLCIRGFDEDEFVFLDFVKDFYVLLYVNDGFYVEVWWEEDDEIIWGNFGEFGEEIVVVFNYVGFVMYLEVGWYGSLIGVVGDDYGKEGFVGKGYVIGFLDDGGEVEYFWVDFERWDGFGCDDDGVEFFKYGVDSDSCIEVCEV